VATAARSKEDYNEVEITMGRFNDMDKDMESWTVKPPRYICTDKVCVLSQRICLVLLMFIM
jgi:hypothetical protein